MPSRRLRRLDKPLVLRFFHGDGSAQQFEAGNKIGGNYPCVGCEAHSGGLDYLAYTFRAKHLLLGERQSFILYHCCNKYCNLIGQEEVSISHRHL